MWNVGGCELEIPFRTLVISEDENYQQNICDVSMEHSNWKAIIVYSSSIVALA